MCLVLDIHQLIYLLVCKPQRHPQHPSPVQLTPVKGPRDAQISQHWVYPLGAWLVTAVKLWWCEWCQALTRCSRAGLLKQYFRSLLGLRKFKVWKGQGHDNNIPWLIPRTAQKMTVQISSHKPLPSKRLPKEGGNIKRSREKPKFPGPVHYILITSRGTGCTTTLRHRGHLHEAQHLLQDVSSSPQ